MIILKSWGFKWGRPPANFIFDVSFLINPWRVKKLRDADKKTILDFMKKQKEFEELTNAFVELISTYYCLWPKETLIFAFCCSAGEYRSPAVIEVLYQRLVKLNIPVKINHNINSKLYNNKIDDKFK